jgi:hypothetical protein
MSQICDMGQMALLPLQRKACCRFFGPKNATALTGFEPMILGTRGQHSIWWEMKQIYVACLKNAVSFPVAQVYKTTGNFLCSPACVCLCELRTSKVKLYNNIKKDVVLW